MPLNPSIRDSEAPNFLGRSQGFTPPEARKVGTNSTFGSVVDTAANLVPVLAEAGDKIVKQSIEEQIRQQADVFNREEGVDASITINGQNASTPKDIQEAEQFLNRMQKARDRGVISAKGFDAKVTSYAKGLRSKYDTPDLRNTIDSMISRYTGVDPMNSVRERVFKEQEDLFKASTDNNSYFEKQKFQYIEQGISQGLVSQEEVDALAGASYVETLKALSPRYKMKGDMDLRKAQREELKGSRELSDQRIDDDIQSDLKQFLTVNLHSVSSNLGKTTEDLKNEIQRLNTAGDSATAQERAGVLEKFKILRANVESNARSLVFTNYAGFNLSKERIDNHLSLVTSEMDSLEKLVTTLDYPGLAIWKNGVDQAEKKGDYQFLSDPYRADLAATRRMMGDSVANTRINTAMMGAKTDEERIAAQQMMFGLYGEKQKTLDLVFQQATSQGVSNPKLFDQAFDTTMADINSKNIDPALKNRAIDNLYGPSNDKFLSNIPLMLNRITGVVDGKRRADYFFKSTSEETLASMKGVKSTDPGRWKNFVDYTKAGFGTLFRESFMKISSAGDSYKISYDPEIQRFRIRNPNPLARVPSTPAQQRENAERTDPIFEAVGRLNNAIKNTSHIIDEDAGDSKLFINEAVKRLATGSVPGVPGLFFTPDPSGNNLEGGAFTFEPGDTTRFTGTARRGENTQNINIGAFDLTQVTAEQGEDLETRELISLRDEGLKYIQETTPTAENFEEYAKRVTDYQEVVSTIRQRLLEQTTRGVKPALGLRPGI
jgi:hypothetical protein